MRKLLKGETRIEFYDSIEDLPHRRYMKFNKEMMRSNDVGCSPTDLLKRIDRALAFINVGEDSKAAKELSNARLTFSYGINAISPKGLALAAIVKSINGEPCMDVTTAGLQDILVKLQEAGILKKEVEKVTEEVKKK